MDARIKGIDSFLERKGTVKVIITKKKYREKGLCIVPIYDPNLRDFRKIPEEMDDHKDKAAYKKLVEKFFPDGNEQVFVDHNRVLDKTVDYDYALMLLLLTQNPTIVKSQSEVVPGITFAYLFDKEHEANVVVKSTRSKFEAIAKVVQMSIENQRRLMFYLGENPDIVSPSILEATLYKKAEDEPDKIMEYFTDADSEVVTMIHILKSEKIITKNKGVYYYGKIYLGQSVREVVSWTKEEKNAEAFAALRKSMRSNLVTE